MPLDSDTLALLDKYYTGRGAGNERMLIKYIIACLLQSITFITTSFYMVERIAFYSFKQSTLYKNHLN